MTRGFFITLEGGEGAGKSTQSRRLADALRAQGHDVVETREPGGTPEAEALRQVFIDHKGNDWPVAAQVLLMSAARVIHTEKLIQPALAAGKIVVCDRYTDSTRVYQGAGAGYASDAIEAIKNLSIGSFEPDMTFIFDIDPAVGLARTRGRDGADDTFEAKDIAFHEKLRGGFRDIARRYPDRCVMIDATASADEIAARMSDEVLKRLKHV